MSRIPTAYAVICQTHGQVFLSQQEYVTQLLRDDARWVCPWCNTPWAEWDGANYVLRGDS